MSIALGDALHLPIDSLGNPDREAMWLTMNFERD
jgi:hypothetical protein